MDAFRQAALDGRELPNGQPAQHNRQLIEAMVRIAQTFGRDPATVAEAREVFAVSGRNTS